MNDFYFDVKDGTDGANNDYFLQFSGAAAIELGLISLEGPKRPGLGTIAAATLIGIFSLYATTFVDHLAVPGNRLSVYRASRPPGSEKGLGIGHRPWLLLRWSLPVLGHVMTQQLNPLVYFPHRYCRLAPMTANILLINEFGCRLRCHYR